MTSYTELTKSYEKLLLVNPHSLPAENRQEHCDELHRLNSEITALDTSRLQSANALVEKESSKIKEAIEKLSDAAVNDDHIATVVNVAAEVIKTVDSVIVLPFN